MSQAARLEAGYLLRQLQRGETLSMPQSRPMPSIGPRCHELRINDSSGTWRVLYRINKDAIVILEVFAKKTGKTPKGVIATCRNRLKEYEMRESKRKKLESKGWKLGGAKELLGLSDQEEMYIELRLKLAEGLKARRLANGVTQVELAQSIRSCQSRVAKMEAGDPTVSLDLLVKSILALGTSNRELAAIIARG